MENASYTVPKPELASAVRSFWQVERTSMKPLAETILPTGLVEIIFNFHDTTTIHAQIAGVSQRLPQCFINGYNTHPIEQTIPRQQLFFGVVLQSTAAKRLFNSTANDFADRCTEMTLVDTSYASLWHRLAEQRTFIERVQLLSTVLVKRLTHMDARELAFDHFINSHAGSTLSVSEAADLLCYSPRQLSRKLQTLIGLNTEETLLYKKYLHALDLIHQSSLSLTQIAHICQFTDQPHFNKTFKSFTGLTPGEYRTRKSQLVGHLFNDVR